MKKGQLKNILRISSRHAYIFFIAPALIYLLMFTVYPSTFGIGLSFTNYHFAYPAWKFVGLKNYADLIQWSVLPRILFNTFVFIFAVVFFQVILGLLIALVLNQPVKMRRGMRTISIIPWVLPAFIVGTLFRRIFNGSKLGLLNMIVENFGIEPRAWLSTPKLAMVLMIFVLVWKGTALSIILELSGLQSISSEYTDAAKIDGASGVQRFFFIIVPMLRNTLLINLIMATSGTFNQIDIPFTLTNGGPERATEVLALSMYKQGFEIMNAGFASTIGSVILIINVLLTLIYLKILQNDDNG